ncbi:MAG: hypothetical protein V5A42_02290, partial [Halofilum sp. (in: g-proteobacteria)]
MNSAPYNVLREALGEPDAGAASPQASGTNGQTDTGSGRERARAIWLSDLHLGTRGCRAEA